MVLTSVDKFCLWKIESNNVDALYVDLFANKTQIPFEGMEWKTNRKIKHSDFKNDFFYQKFNPGKNNVTSDWLRTMGKILFNSEDWFHAMEHYSAVPCCVLQSLEQTTWVFLMPVEWVFSEVYLGSFVIISICIEKPFIEKYFLLQSDINHFDEILMVLIQSSHIIGWTCVRIVLHDQL